MKNETDASFDIAYSDNQFVAVESGAIWSSRDGTTWTKHVVMPPQSVSGATYGNNQFVAVGYYPLISGGFIIASPDGISWTNRAQASVSAIAYGGGQFVAVGSGVILTSPDGNTWTSHPTGSQDQLGSIVFCGNQFVALDQNGAMLSSADGTNWIRHVSGTGNALFGVACGGGSFIAVGAEGTILQSGAISAPLPVLGTLVLLPSGTARLMLTGQAGHTYLIQASTNLTDWMTLTDLAITNTSAGLFDPAATNFPRRFYRAVSVVKARASVGSFK